MLTIHPPTYEIFTMISKVSIYISTQSYLHIYTVISTYLSVSTQVALLSLGRLMYFGKRREMLPYFAFIEYPCPAYKNPADYYRE